MREKGCEGVYDGFWYYSEISKLDGLVSQTDANFLMTGPLWCGT